MLVNFVYDPVRYFFMKCKTSIFFNSNIFCAEKQINSLAPGFKCLNQYFVVDIDMVEINYVSS